MITKPTIRCRDDACKQTRLQTRVALRTLFAPPSLIADHDEAPAVSMISGTNLQGGVEPEKKPARLWLGQGFVSAGHNATCRLSHFPGACGDSDCQAHLTLSSTPSLCTCNRPGDHSRRGKKMFLLETRSECLRILFRVACLSERGLRSLNGRGAPQMG